MIRPAYRLTIAPCPVKGAGVVAVLGKDIRSKPEEIARHCLVSHRAINEDVATIAESVALADRIFSRHRGVTWSRLIEVEIPVFELSRFSAPEVVAALTDAIHFVTGDTWHFTFVQRPGHALSQQMLPFEKVSYHYVMPYSDGLDSYAQGKLLEKGTDRDSVLRIRSARMGQDTEELRRHVLRVPRGFGSMAKKEQTYRSRPFVFFSFAGIGAFVAGAKAVVVGESGQGALGPALVRYADEWPFRSTHPGFISRMQRYLSLAFASSVHFEMPQLWRTKSEVLLTLREEDLLGRWEDTSSCSVRPNDRHSARACGICGGCMLRALATHSAGLVDAKLKRAFDPTRRDALASDGQSMSKSERHMAVRAIGSMVELARLPQTPLGDALIESESLLLNDPDPSGVAGKIRDLVARHSKEWDGFVASLPVSGWASTFARQL